MQFTDKCSRSKIKERIIKHKIIEYKCAECDLSEWNGKPLSLHLDHINGVNNDNRLANLRFLCPNCHSQTDSYCGKNNPSKFSTKNKKVSDDDLIEAMKTEKTPIHALRKFGMAGAGNYARVYRLAEIHNIEHMKKNNVKKVVKEVTCAAEGCSNTFIKVRSKVRYCSPKCGHTVQKRTTYTDNEILELLKTNRFNYSKTGRELGVSDNAIRKRVKDLL